MYYNMSIDLRVPRNRPVPVVGPGGEVRKHATVLLINVGHKCLWSLLCFESIVLKYKLATQNIIIIIIWQRDHNLVYRAFVISQTYLVQLFNVKLCWANSLT